MITTSRSEDFFWILVNKVYRLMTSVWHCFIFDFPIWLCLEIIFDFYLIWIFIMLKRNDNVYHTYCYRYAFLWCTSLLIKVYSIADCTVCTPGRTDGNEGLVSTNHNDSQRDFSVKSYFSSLSWMHASHCRRGRHIRKKRIHLLWFYTHRESMEATCWRSDICSPWPQQLKWPHLVDPLTVWVPLSLTHSTEWIDEHHSAWQQKETECNFLERNCVPVHRKLVVIKYLDKEQGLCIWVGQGRILVYKCKELMICPGFFTPICRVEVLL